MTPGASLWRQLAPPEQPRLKWNWPPASVPSLLDSSWPAPRITFGVRLGKTRRERQSRTSTFYFCLNNDPESFISSSSGAASTHSAKTAFSYGYERHWLDEEILLSLLSWTLNSKFTHALPPPNLLLQHPAAKTHWHGKSRQRTIQFFPKYIEPSTFVRVKRGHI